MFLVLNGVTIEAKQYIGIGVLRVLTTRGEVGARSTDFILQFPDGASCVLPESTVNLFIQEEVDIQQTRSISPEGKFPGSSLIPEEERVGGASAVERLKSLGREALNKEEMTKRVQELSKEDMLKDSVDALGFPIDSSSDNSVDK